MTSSLDAPGRPGGRWSTSEDGLPFRDLNGNGELDPYEDPRVPIEDRVADLLARMTLEEKAAQLFHQGLVVPDDSAVTDEPDAMTQVSTRGLVELGLTHFNVYWTPGPQALAEWHNRMQEAAEATRLGIPITISSDPRHGLGSNPATSMAGSGFSSGPIRSGSLRRGTKVSCASSPTSSAASTSPSGSGSPCTRAPTWRPSRVGAGRPGPSARTPRSSRGSWPRTSAACRATRSGRGASRA